MSRRLLRRARGYTVVEVMSAMTLFAVGAAGVISMQRVTIQGGEDARRLDLATNIANEWAGRLHRDASFWTQPNTATPLVTNHTTATTWLKVLTDTSKGAVTGWEPATAPSGPTMGWSTAFDMFGRDMAPTEGGHIFCAQYRLSWITAPGSGGLAPARPLMRAEIRVFYRRLEEAPIGDCFATGLAPDSNKTRFHFVYVTTALRPASDQ